jgi:hypothetical protein
MTSILRLPRALASLALALALSLSFAYIAPSSAHATSSGTMYFMADGVMASNSDFTVQVRIDTGGQTVNAVQADFTYPTGVLTYVSSDTSSSAFDIDASSSAGSGTVSMARGASGTPRVGDLLVARVTFHVATTGSATLAIQGSSGIAEAVGSTNILVTKTDGVYTSLLGPLVPVYRMSNSITHERLFTTSVFERDNALTRYAGWGSEGIGFSGAPSGAAGAVPVYRLSNSITHERLFTTSSTERDNATAHYPGWTYEGIDFNGVPGATIGAVPIYRLSNSITHERLFTTSAAERDAAVANYPGWTYEGIAFYGSNGAGTAPIAGKTPVYRLSNSITHERLFTTSAFERDNATAHYPGWTYEGVGFNGVGSSFAGAVPIYRLSNSITHERLFTTSSTERDNATAHYPGWTYEGIGFYGVPSATPGSVPVFRLSNSIFPERLFTISSSERDNATSRYRGWSFEGIAFYGAP